MNIKDLDISVISAGNDAAFYRIYKKYKDQMFRYAYSILKDYQLAEDIVQDAFAIIIQNADKYTNINEKGWIMRIIHNLSINRKKVFAREIPVQIISYEVPERIGWFYEVMQLIPDDIDRQIVVLRIDAELKNIDVASMLEMTPKATSKRYRKTIKFLKPILANYYRKEDD